MKPPGATHPEVAKIAAFSKEHQAELRPLELDVLSQASVDAAVETVIQEGGRIDVVIHPVPADKYVKVPCIHKSMPRIIE